MNTPAISIVIPAYNAARFLPRTLDSLLAQTCKDFEAIIIDDGSSDNTPEVAAPYVKDPRFRYFRQENRGVSAARNFGADVACGEYLALCDADDLWEPGKLQLQLEAFVADAAVGLVYCDISTIDADDQLIKAHSNSYACYSGDVTARLVRRNFVPAPGVMIRRSCFQQCGGFDTALSLAEDYDLWLRLSTVCRFKHIPAALVRYRRHDTQATRTRQEEIFHAHISVIEKFLRDNPHHVSPAEANLAIAETRKNLGHYYLKTLHDKKLARASFRSAISASPLYLSAWSRLLRSYFQSV